jgi:Concanavalin A-like lectin/glucanases superfamily/PEP-CTERM motif
MRNGTLAQWAAAVAVALVAAAAPAQPIQNGLVLHLTFDNNVNDQALGNGAQNGTIVRPNATSNYGPGVNTGLSQAFRTQGTSTGTPASSNNNYVSLGTQFDSLLTNPNGSFSVSFWAKAVQWNDDPAFISNKNWDSGSNNGFVIATEGDGHLQWNYRTDADTRRDYDGPAGTFGSAAGGGTNVWHHVVVTHDRSSTSGNIVTYLDGAQVDSRPTVNTGGALGSLGAGLALNILQDGTGNYTDGTNNAFWGDASIDDLGLWNRVLSAADVTTIRNAGLLGINISNIGAVPEPGSLALCGLAVAGLAGAAGRRWRDRRRAR